MAKSKSRRKGRKTRRPTKAEIKRQKALERFILAIVTTVIFFFAMARLGIFGITVYNLVRLAVGSLAYVLMVAVLLYFLGFKWFHKQAGLIGGFVVTMIGLLLEWHAYLFSLSAFRGKEIFSTTASLIFSDLVKFKVTKFVGGGMLGAVLYKPVAFLFSNVGTFLIGGLFIILGLFLMSPWEVYDLIDFFKEKSQEWAAKHEIRKQKRFVKREEKRALAEQKRQEKAQKAEEERLAQLTVDQETGEILDVPDDNEASIFDNILVENAAVEPEILAYEHVSEGLEETASEENLKPEVTPAEEEMIDQEDDGEPLEVDFTAKANLLYKLPTIDLFAPDKPKNQSKEKNIVRRNIKVLEDTFNSFGIDVKVERAEIGPSVTKYEVKPAVGVRVNRISNLADDLALALAAKDVRIEAPIPGKSLDRKSVV